MKPRALKALTAYRIISRAYFHLPVLFVFLFHGGLPVATIELLLAGYGLVVAVAPQLTGRLTRRFPIPVVLITGECIKVAGLITLAVGPSVATAAAGQVLNGVGFALTAGADSVLLSLLCSGDEFRRRESATQGWMFVASFAAGALGALAFSRNPALPFLASALAALAALVMMLIVRHSTLPSPGEVSAPGKKGALAAATGSGRSDKPGQAPREALFWQLYYAINRAFLLAPYVGFIPYLLVSGLHLGLAWFGTVLGLYTAGGLVAARSSPRLLARFPAHILAFAPVVLATTGLVLLGMARVLPIALCGIVALGLGGGLIRPSAMSNLETHMRELGPASRRKLTTRMEQLQAVLSGVILITGGILLSDISLASLMLGLAAANLIAQCLALPLARMVRSVPRQAPEQALRRVRLTVISTRITWWSLGSA